jgi:hypothetical protein
MLSFLNRQEGVHNGGPGWGGGGGGGRGGGGGYRGGRGGRGPDRDREPPLPPFPAAAQTLSLLLEAYTEGPFVPTLPFASLLVQYAAQHRRTLGLPLALDLARCLIKHSLHSPLAALLRTHQAALTQHVAAGRTLPTWLAPSLLKYCSFNSLLPPLGVLRALTEDLGRSAGQLSLSALTNSLFSLAILGETLPWSVFHKIGTAMLAREDPAGAGAMAGRGMARGPHGDRWDPSLVASCLWSLSIMAAGAGRAHLPSEPFFWALWSRLAAALPADPRAGLDGKLQAKIYHSWLLLQVLR